jgi:hypothetical protein
MLPLKALVNALQNTSRYPDCLVRASPFFDGRLEHHHTGLVLEKPSDRFDIELPEFRQFGRRVVALGRSGRFDRSSMTSERSGHGYLCPPARITPPNDAVFHIPPRLILRYRILKATALSIASLDWLPMVQPKKVRSASASTATGLLFTPEFGTDFDYQRSRA